MWTHPPNESLLKQKTTFQNEIRKHLKSEILVFSRTDIARWKLYQMQRNTLNEKLKIVGNRTLNTKSDSRSEEGEIDDEQEKITRQNHDTSKNGY